MSKSSDDAPIGCVEGGGFVEVGRQEMVGPGLESGLVVRGASFVTLLYSVLSLGNKHRGAVMAQALVVTQLAYGHGVQDIYICIGIVYIRV